MRRVSPARAVDLSMLQRIKVTVRTVARRLRLRELLQQQHYGGGGETECTRKSKGRSYAMRGGVRCTNRTDDQADDSDGGLR